MAIRISNSVPVPDPAKNPKTRRGRKGDGRQAAICALALGQSFLLNSSIKSAGVLRWWARAKYPDRDFRAETEGDKTRIWRIK